MEEKLCPDSGKPCTNCGGLHESGKKPLSVIVRFDDESSQVTNLGKDDPALLVTSESVMFAGDGIEMIAFITMAVLSLKERWDFPITQTMSMVMESIMTQDPRLALEMAIEVNKMDTEMGRG